MRVSATSALENKASHTTEAQGCCGLWAKPGKASAKTQRFLPKEGTTSHRQAPDAQASGRSLPPEDLSRPFQLLSGCSLRLLCLFCFWGTALGTLLPV